jgi:hypothetical protein
MIRKLLEKFARGLLALVAEPEKEPPCCCGGPCDEITCDESCCQTVDPKEQAAKLREIADKLDPPPAAMLPFLLSLTGPSPEKLEDIRRISLELRKASAEKASPEEMERFAKARMAGKLAKVRRNS